MVSWQVLLLHMRQQHCQNYVCQQVLVPGYIQMSEWLFTTLHTTTQCFAFTVGGVARQVPQGLSGAIRKPYEPLSLPSCGEVQQAGSQIALPQASPVSASHEG